MYIKVAINKRNNWDKQHIIKLFFFLTQNSDSNLFDLKVFKFCGSWTKLSCLASDSHLFSPSEAG